jgi:hypothetical protein
MLLDVRENEKRYEKRYLIRLARLASNSRFAVDLVRSWYNRPIICASSLSSNCQAQIRLNQHKSSESVLATSGVSFQPAGRLTES